MNRGTIRTKARRKLDEISPRFWTDDDLNDYIMEGYLFYWGWLINANHPGILRDVLLSITAGVRSVALPEDYAKSRLVEKVFSNFRSQTLNYKERFDTPQFPSGASGEGYVPDYSFVGQNLILNPTPQGNETNALRLTYIYQPPELTLDAQSPVYPFIPLYHNMLVRRVVVLAKEKEEAMGMAGAPMGEILNELQVMEQTFKANIETESLQRQETEPFPTDCGGGLSYY
jgi:hypothetical protein